MDPKSLKILEYNSYEINIQSPKEQGVGPPTPTTLLIKKKKGLEQEENNAAYPARICLMESKETGNEQGPRCSKSIHQNINTPNSTWD